ncbi:MAG: aminopeptidase P family protein [Prevotellaceae bacterium]|nr:aminopeptidase P family protein [Prevotellaceae bacterium]
MFSKSTYVERRNELKKLVGSGLIVLFGNNDSPANYPSNTYKFRQDSSFLYYFGLHRNGLVGVIDVDNDREYLVGDEIDIEDIVWYGSVTSVAEMAEMTGVARTAAMRELPAIVESAKAQGEEVHFLPPYRFDNQIQIMDLLGIHPSQQKAAASLKLIAAVVKMRTTKTEEEIAELERAAEIGYEMHTTAMRLCRPGITEQYIGGMVDGIANAYGCMVSFQTIATQHGEVMHGNPSTAKLEAGRLMLVDAGAETNENYCSDNTRTTPVSGVFTQKQKDIYNIVVECHDHVLEVAKPGVKWWDVHFAVCRIITERLQQLGLMKGDVEESLKAGAHAMFLPHGLGHSMGMDVHDMEGLGQVYVGFDNEVRPSTQFGTNALRFGRRLQKGFVVTDEPGIYFIPALIDDWKKNGTNAQFLNFDKIDEYRDFGGIRIEDDVLITDEGCRFIGSKRIPYHVEDVEEFMRSREA